MKSQLHISEKEKKEVYPYALNLVIHESDSLWQISNVFLVANSVIAAVIGVNLFSSGYFSIGYFAISLIGFLLTLVWLFSIERARKYHEFRIAQAKQREPNNWVLVNGDVEEFAKGGTIEIDDKKYNVGFGIFSNILLVRIIVIIFILFYLGIIIFKFSYHSRLNNYPKHSRIIRTK